MPGQPDRADLNSFTSHWRSLWPDSPPVADDLKWSAAASWLRFYTLPRGKRYASNAAESEEIISRHLKLLHELNTLAQTPNDDLRVITAAWSRSSTPVEPKQYLVDASPSSSYWCSVSDNMYDPDNDSWVHLYVGVAGLSSDSLRPLLRLVARDRAPGVIICPPNAVWLYHPYDGGADVVTAASSIRDVLRERYSEWIPDDC